MLRLDPGLDAKEPEQDLEVMSLQRLQSPEILRRFGEFRPVERTTDPRFERNLDGVAAQIERPVESPCPEKNLSVAKSRSSYRLKVSGSQSWFTMALAV